MGWNAFWGVLVVSFEIPQVLLFICCHLGPERLSQEDIRVGAVCWKFHGVPASPSAGALLSLILPTEGLFQASQEAVLPLGAHRD